MVLLLADHREVFKTGVFFLEGEFNRADGSVSLFANDYFGDSLFRVVFRFIVNLVAIYKRYKIRVLFNGPLFPQIRHHRSAVGSVFDLSV